MFEFLSKLWDTAPFPARWHCGEWSAGHGWLHICSDVAIFLAYMAIPVVLAVLITRRKDLPFPRILWLFVAFIALCGMTHIIEAVIFWRPIYRVAGLVKFCTAVVSWTTVFALVPTVKRVMTFRSPEALEREVEARTRELAREKATLEAILDSLDAGVVVASPEGRVVLMNRRAEEILGETIADEALHDWPRLLNVVPTRGITMTTAEASATQNTSEEPSIPLLDALERGRSVREQELHMQNRDSGKPMTLNFSARTIRASTGNSEGAVACFTDITSRVNAERELARSNRDLQQFAYASSHDLVEPLRQVASYSGLLAETYGEKFDDKGARYLNYVKEGSERMQSLVHGLLAYSRVGTRGFNPEWVDVESLVNDILTDYDSALKSADGEVQIEGKMPRLFVDPTQLRQVMQNLIANGLKFRSQEAPRLTLRVEQDGAYFRFSLQDNGIGIAPQHHERIFRVFQRLHTRNEFEGTGIGLALCQRIVTGWGGEIWLKSEPGQGSTFFFTVPRGRPSEVAAN